MAKSKDPAFLFYPSDFILGTYTMTDEQVGKYIRLLCLQFSKGKLTERDMLSINRNDDIYVKEKFKCEDGLYYNERLLNETNERERIAQINRENGSKGGNPNLVKGKPNPYYKQEDNRKDNQTDILRDNRKINITLEDININEDVVKKENAVNNYFEVKELNDIFLDFIKMRKTKIKNGAMTDRAIKIMVNKLSKYDVSIAIKMIENSLLNNWKDIYDLKDEQVVKDEKIKGITYL